MTGPAEYPSRPPGPVPFGAPGWQPGPPAPRRRRGGIVLAIVVTAVCALAVAGLAAVGLDRLRVTISSAEEKLSQDVAAAVAERDRAFRRKDEAAFLAPVDPAATRLLAAERRLFRNLVALPYSSARFEVEVGFDGYPSDRAPGARQYDVAFVHRVEGVDVGDVALAYEQHWVRRDGRAVLVASTGLFGGSSAPEPGPLDLTALTVRNGPRVTLAAPAPGRGLAAVAAEAERAAARVLAAWPRRSGRPAPSRFFLFVSPDRAGAARWFGGPPHGDVAGYAVGLREGWRVDDPWIGGSRVVVDLAASRSRLAEVLRHEFAHAVTYSLKRSTPPFAEDDGVPVWADEGFASYVEEIDTPLGQLDRLPAVRDLVRSPRWNRQLPPDERTFFFAGSGTDLFATYGLAQLAFRFIAERHGRAAPVEFYARLAAVGTARADEAFRAVLGQDRAAFQRDWVAWLAGVTA